MDDLISRQAAINSIRETSPAFFSAYQHNTYVDKQEVMIRLRALPSVKPERKNGKKFIEIVVAYPAICPYPEYEGKPYFSIRYEENGEKIEGFGTYKPEVLSQYIREYFMGEEKGRGISMTRKEAIDVLKKNYPDSCFELLREAVDTAFEALAKMEAIQEVIDMPFEWEQDDRRRYARIVDIVRKDLAQEVE